ncbi:serine/threonine-protein kinase pim-2-like [Genypterus blacodes]|uniref:serine/threonine-protein kinase pim-2-like n=1 Tax=Genypterus blacodes TaxID=154954 RepID=UPI003F76C08A
MRCDRRDEMKSKVFMRQYATDRRHGACLSAVLVGEKRKVSDEESPEREATAKRARTSPRASPHHSLTSSRWEERGSKRKASCEQDQGSVMKRSRRSLQPYWRTSCEPSATVSSSSSGHDQPDRRDVFQATYVEKERLGKGGFGSVFAGYRKQDNLPVAMKHISLLDIDQISVYTNEQEYKIALEVALLSMVGPGFQPFGSSPAVALIDCFELDQELVLIMERPVPCIDLLDYIWSNSCCELQEEEAKFLMKQLVDAFIEIHSRGVFHRDIKPENILVQLGAEGPRIRVIDFGCGTMMRPGLYTDLAGGLAQEGRAVVEGSWFDSGLLLGSTTEPLISPDVQSLGTPDYLPPEFVLCGAYEAGPTTVWQLGMVLFMMLHGVCPFHNRREIAYKTPPISKRLPRYCRHFLFSCLNKNPYHRPTLEDLRNHRWLQ